MRSRCSRLATLLALLAAVVILSGCVEVTTKVSGRGRIERTIVVTVDSKHAKSVRDELRLMFRRGWRIHQRREADSVTFTCTSRGLRCRPAADDGVTISVRKRRLTAKYIYIESPQLDAFLPNKGERDLAGGTPVRYVIEMPGRIVEQTVPIGFSLEKPNRIVKETDLKLLPERRIEVHSEAKLWTDLFFLVAFALSVPGYIAYVVLARRAAGPPSI